MATEVTINDTITAYPASVDDSTLSYIANASYPLSNGYTSSDSYTYATIGLNTGEGAETYVQYRFSDFSIPSSSTINSISISTRSSISTVSSSILDMSDSSLFVCTSNQESASFPWNSTAVTSHTFTPSWTVSQINNYVGVGVQITRGSSKPTGSQNVKFYGATLIIDYSYITYDYDIIASSSVQGVTISPSSQVVREGSDATTITINNPNQLNLVILDTASFSTTRTQFSDSTYSYNLTNVDDDHTIIIQRAAPLMIKENGSWIASDKIYKKINGVWQVQENMPFISGHGYKNGGNLFDDTPSLVKALSNLEAIGVGGCDSSTSTSMYYVLDDVIMEDGRVLGANYCVSGVLTPGEHYYAYAASSAASYRSGSYSTGSLFSIFEIVYNSSSNIVVNRLFSNSTSDNSSKIYDLNQTSITIRVGNKTAKTFTALVPRVSSNGVDFYNTYWSGTVIFYKISSSSIYSYSELNNLISNSTYDRGVSAYSSDAYSLYSMSVVSSEYSYSSPFKNIKGYVLCTYLNYYSLLYLDTTGSEYAKTSVVSGNNPNNLSLCKDYTSQISYGSTHNKLIYLSLDGTSSVSGYGNFSLIIPEDT